MAGVSIVPSNSGIADNQVVVHFNHFPYLKNRATRGVVEVGDYHAEQVALKAQQNTVRIKTAKMYQNWAWHLERGSQWVIYNEQYYHIFQEFGTVSIEASPMLVPAFNEELPLWMEDLRNLVKIK